MSEFTLTPTKTNMRIISKRVDSQRSAARELVDATLNTPELRELNEAVQDSIRDINVKKIFVDGQFAVAQTAVAKQKETLVRLDMLIESCALVAEVEGLAETRAAITSARYSSATAVAAQMKQVPHFGHQLGVHLIEVRDALARDSEKVALAEEEFEVVARALMQSVISSAALVRSGNMDVKPHGIKLPRKRKAQKTPLTIVPSSAATSATVAPVTAAVAEAVGIAAKVGT